MHTLKDGVINDSEPSDGDTCNEFCYISAGYFYFIMIISVHIYSI